MQAPGSAVDIVHEPIKFLAPDGSVLWESNRGPQTEVLFRQEDEILFGGARGGGKSAAGIAWLLLGNLGLDPSDPYYHTYINDPKYRALVLRRNADDLKEWIDEAKRIYEPLGAKFTGKPVVIEFPSDAKIYTNHLDSEDAFEKYKGWSLWKILIEELTLIPKKASYIKLLASNRAMNSKGKVHAQLFATTNPDGDGAAWVCDRWIEVPSKAGRNIPWGQRMVNPLTGMSRVFVPAKVGDNPYALSDKTYMGKLLEQDEQTQDAWIRGLWHSMAGTFFREWRNQLIVGPRAGEEKFNANHVINPVPLKPWWFRWGSGDWGYDHPSALYKFCKNQSDGRIHVYDELVVRQLGSFELGTAIARWWAPDLEMLPDRKITLHLSPDAFNKQDARNSIAQQVQAGIMAVLGPGSAFILRQNEEEKDLAQRNPEAAQRLFDQRRMQETGNVCISLVRANHDRPAGAAFIRDLLRWRPSLVPVEPDVAYAKMLYETKGLVAYSEYLSRFKGVKAEVLPKIQVWQRNGEGQPGCPRLIRTFPMLQHDPKHVEDVLKVDAEGGQGGDDPYDGFRYGAMAAKDLEKTIPRAYFVAEETAEFGKGYDDPFILQQIRMTQESRYDKQYPESGSFSFTRSGAHRWN